MATARAKNRENIDEIELTVTGRTSGNKVTHPVGGTEWKAKAKPITDRTHVHEIVEKFQVKYDTADVKKYYSKFDVAAEVPLA